MKKHIHLLPGCLAAALPLLLLCSCVEKSKKADTPPAQTAAVAEQQPQHQTVVDPTLLPNRFRQTGYVISEEKKSSASGDSGMEELQLKVGVNISTNEPIPLRDAMKALVKTKNMGLSWASDTDQNLLVDIDIRANDSFYEAVDNILRQLDYFHEVKGNTIVIKYRETKKYTVALPYVRHHYHTHTGSTAAQMNIKEWDNLIDQWETIKGNLDSLLATWSTEVASAGKDGEDKKDDKGDAGKKEEAKPAAAETGAAARRVAKSTDASYTIDKTVGLVTVHAPRSLQEKFAEYLTSLEKEYHKQVIIDAKIIEVRLSENSSLGVNWNVLLDRLRLEGIGYGKEKYNSRENSDTQETRSGRNYTDTRENADSRMSSRNSVSEYGEDGSSRTESTSETTSDSKTSLADGTRTRSSSGSTASGTTSDEVFGASSFVGDRSEDSSTSSSSRSITDALSMATSAATFIGSGGGMMEAMSTGVTLYGFNFTSFIKALQEQGQTSVLSNPKISMLSGQHALISVGRDVTYIKKVESKTTEGGGLASTVEAGNILSGISMALNAVIKGDDEVVMNLIPVSSELVEPIAESEVGQGNRIGLPIVNKREMNTWVRVKDGSMLVVGGLITETDAKFDSHLPGTKNIPYLKYLFGYEEKNKIKRELIILLRPRIVTN